MSSLDDLVITLTRRIREHLPSPPGGEELKVERLNPAPPTPVAGVDGGFSTIVVTPALALHYVRVASVMVDERGGRSFSTSEYIVYSRVVGDSVAYEAYNLSGKPVIKEAPHVEVKREGVPVLDFERATLKAMTYLELLHAAKLASSGYRIVLRDGTLNVHPYPIETRMVADRIYGVSKTSSSTSIINLPPSTMRIAGPWISAHTVTPPVGRRGIADILRYVVYEIVQVPVKLSPHGRPLVFEAFKVEEGLEDVLGRMKRTLSTLLNFVDDTGNYPYPLVEADRLASVRKAEGQAIAAKVLHYLEEYDPEVASKLKMYSIAMRTHEWGR